MKWIRNIFRRLSRRRALDSFTISDWVKVDGKFQHVIMVVSEGWVQTYINGLKVPSSQSCEWNRQLTQSEITQSEITQLNNCGNGVSYDDMKEKDHVNLTDGLVGAIELNE